MSISLQKGSSLSLKKESGAKITRFQVGAGWDRATSSSRSGFFGKFLSSPEDSEIDLDLSAILYSGKVLSEAVYFGRKKSNNNALKHSGDNLTGEGEGDDEVITVDLNQIPDSVDSIFFVITSYSGQKFSEVENVFVRAIEVDEDFNKIKEVLRYDVDESDSKNTGLVISALRKSKNGDWDFEAIGRYHDARTYKDMVNFCKEMLPNMQQ